MAVLFAEVFKSKLVRVSAWTFSSKQPAAASSTLLIPLLAQTFRNWLKHSSSDETKPGDVWFNSDHVSGPAEWWETAEGRNQDAASDESYVLCTCGCDHTERNVTHHHFFLLLPPHWAPQHHWVGFGCRFHPVRVKVKTEEHQFQSYQLQHKWIILPSILHQLKKLSEAFKFPQRLIQTSTLLK